MQGVSVASSFINYAPCIVANAPTGIAVAPSAINFQPNGDYLCFLTGLLTSMFAHCMVCCSELARLRKANSSKQRQAQLAISFRD